MKKIEIRLFGTPAILADGEPVGFPYKKVEGFLYYLCVKKQITREEAICLLWGDEDEASGRKKSGTPSTRYGKSWIRTLS